MPWADSPEATAGAFAIAEALHMWVAIQRAENEARKKRGRR